MVKTGQPVTQKDNYYVSVLDGHSDAYILAAGPYKTEEEAASHTNEVFVLIRDFKDSHWMSVGTCGQDGMPAKTKWGVL